MPSSATIWHYPRCSKSRKTLALLRETDLSIDIRRYLDDPPSAEELRQALDALGIDAQELVRKKEDQFKALNIDEDALDEGDWIDLMVQYPKLIERPVVLTDEGAILGRPPEAIHSIID